MGSKKTISGRKIGNLCPPQMVVACRIDMTRTTRRPKKRAQPGLFSLYQAFLQRNPTALCRDREKDTTGGEAPPRFCFFHGAVGFTARSPGMSHRCRPRRSAPVITSCADMAGKDPDRAHDLRYIRHVRGRGVQPRSWYP